MPFRDKERNREHWRTADRDSLTFRCKVAPQERTAIERLLRLGVSRVEVARRYGRGYVTVRKIARAMKQQSTQKEAM